LELGESLAAGAMRSAERETARAQHCRYESYDGKPGCLPEERKHLEFERRFILPVISTVARHDAEGIIARREVPEIGGAPCAGVGPFAVTPLEPVAELQPIGGREAEPGIVDFDGVRTGRYLHHRTSARGEVAF